MNRKFKVRLNLYLICCLSFFQTAFSIGLERFQLKLNTKAKEAFEQINRTAQERLENDQIKVKILMHGENLSSLFLDKICSTSFKNHQSSYVR